MADAIAPKSEAPAPVADPKAAAAPVVEEPKEEYIVSGKKVLLTKAQAKAAVQKGLFADQQLKSVEVLKSKATALMEALKTPEGLLGVLKDPSLGASPKEVFRKLMQSDIIDDELKEDIGKWTYENIVKKAQLSPEQIEQEKKLSDYERLKKQEEDRARQDEESKQFQIVQQVRNEIHAEISKQIIADKTFPQTAETVRAVAEKLRVMNKKGAPVSAESITKALGLVKKDILTHQQAMFDALEDPQALVDLFGRERALKMSRALVALIQKKDEKTEVKPKEDVKDDTKTTDKIDKKYGKTRHGYSIMDVG